MTRFFVEAEAELFEGAQFYENSQIGLGYDFLNVIETAIRTIELAPRRWPVIRGSIRRYLVPKYPYGIIYVFYHDEIVIVAVAHLTRNPSYWTGRIEDQSAE